MRRHILRYRAARPCDIGGPALPHIQIHDEDDPAGETATDIYYYSKRGQRAAERIAREIAATGVALAYPWDSVEVFAGPMHRVVAVGARVAEESDE
jgi:hypothetical protein